MTFEDLVLSRSRFETRRRRIASIALAAGGRHRVGWMDRLLPYCPETLERLVDSCSECAGPLLWTGAGRIDVCGRCGETVQPSAAAPLPAALAEDYRAFAGLSSPIRGYRLPILAALPVRLAGVPCGTLSRLAFTSGASSTILASNPAPRRPGAAVPPHTSHRRQRPASACSGAGPTRCAARRQQRPMRSEVSVKNSNAIASD